MRGPWGWAGSCKNQRRGKVLQSNFVLITRCPGAGLPSPPRQLALELLIFMSCSTKDSKRQHIQKTNSVPLHVIGIQHMWIYPVPTMDGKMYLPWEERVGPCLPLIFWERQVKEIRFLLYSLFEQGPSSVTPTHLTHGVFTAVVGERGGWI